MLNYRAKRTEFICLTALVWLASSFIFGCGPSFPNSILGLGDFGALRAPDVWFAREIEAMQLIPKFGSATPPTNGYPAQTHDAEINDLRAALARQDQSASIAERVVAAHQGERAKIKWPAGAGSSLRLTGAEGPRIAGAEPSIVPGLPGEFADYFEGAMAWHQGLLPQARAAWERLLGRARAERHHKSTWAAYMLGNVWAEEDWRRAVAYFAQVRALAKDGFADSLGLAVASLGWEARLQLRHKNYGKAIELYLEQAASGDATAIKSLRTAAAMALRDARAPLATLARNSRAQRVITAYLIAGGWREPAIDVDGVLVEQALRLIAKHPGLAAKAGAAHTLKEPVVLWLEAVENANVKDVPSAERLALAAYQAGKMPLAQRWIDRASSSPTARWIQAKLWLYAGRIDEAISILSELARSFPAQTDEGNPAAARQLAHNIYFPDDDVFHPVKTANKQLLGELGCLRLTRNQFAEALDLLLRADYWMDAAYVAERVLTLDELKTYVDAYWSEPGPGRLSETQATLRYLLARRLMRASRLDEARSYYPGEVQKIFDDYRRALHFEGGGAHRGTSLFEAATILRARGMELMGTEVEPDWTAYGGYYHLGDTAQKRIAHPNRKFLGPAAEEIRRAYQHIPRPNERFHYRYLAADLAWRAAGMLPDNSDETARVLCTAGSWLKLRDPHAADRFYKALVRRCGKTQIGALADRMRWFPVLDPAGNLKTNAPGGEALEGAAPPDSSD